jgi:hypothetical protein
VTPPGARASRFRAGERHQNGSSETSCLTSPPSVLVKCLPICLKTRVEGYGVRGDQPFPRMEDRGKRHGGKLGSDGMPFYTRSESAIATDRRIRKTRSLRLLSLVVKDRHHGERIVCRSSPNRTRLQRHRMSFKLSAIRYLNVRWWTWPPSSVPTSDPIPPFSRCVRPECPVRRLCGLPRQATMRCGTGACVTLNGTPRIILGGIWHLRHQLYSAFCAMRPPPNDDSPPWSRCSILGAFHCRLTF